MNGLDITSVMAPTLTDYKQTVHSLHALLRRGTATEAAGS
jgi:hypothetical protein